MTTQTTNLKTIREQAKFGLILASAWVLTACSGYGTTGGGLQVSSSGITYNGSEFTNGSTTVPVVVQPDSNPGTVVSPVSVAKPATEEEAFNAIEAAHTEEVRIAFQLASISAQAAFDDLSPKGPPASPSNPYGGVLPPPVTPPTNPIDNPPTGVDNPDKLPVLDASAAKKGGVARAGADLVIQNQAALRQFVSSRFIILNQDLIRSSVENLEALNLTNLSAETQSMVHGNILMLSTLLSVLNK